MIHILGLIAKGIGCILLGILVLLLVVLFSAIRYRIEGKKKEKFEGRIRITWLWRLLSLTAVFKDGLKMRAKVFGKTVWKFSSLEEEEENFQTVEEREEWEEIKGQGKPRENIPSRQAEPERKAEDRKPEIKTEKKGWFQRRYDQILALFRKLQFSFLSICGKLKQGEEKIEQLQAKWARLKELLADPANQQSARLVFRQGKKILKAFLPRKGKAQIRFGLADPAQMGQILSAAAFCYPFTRDRVAVYPVFGQNLLEGEGKVQGHIRIGFLLCYALRLLFDQNIRKHLWKLLRPGARIK